MERSRPETKRRSRSNRGEDSSTRVAGAVSDIAAGRLVIVVGQLEGRWTAVLAGASTLITPLTLDALGKLARGSVFIGLSGERLTSLGLPTYDESLGGTSARQRWATTVDRRGHHGLTIADQTATMRALCSPDTHVGELVTPGQVHVIQTAPWGYLQNPRHIEAATDLAKLAGLFPSAVVGPILDKVGDIANAAIVSTIAAESDLVVISVEDIVCALWTKLALIKEEVGTFLPTVNGELSIRAFRSLINHRIAVVITPIDQHRVKRLPVFLHRYGVAPDAFGSIGCSCRARLEAALRVVSAGSGGALVYLLDDGVSALGLDHGPNCPLPFSVEELGITSQVLQVLKPSGLDPIGLSPRQTRALQQMFIDSRAAIANA